VTRGVSRSGLATYSLALATPHTAIVWREDSRGSPIAGIEWLAAQTAQWLRDCP
jgi:hypothetical protein